MKKHVVILTGAGVSKESGIPTFRDSDGLWENHKVEDVATPQGWFENPKLVWRFYQERRRSMIDVKPNKSHYALVELERKLIENGHKFTLITQNIDGLHLDAGSKNVIEMHGCLRKLKCQKCEYMTNGYDYLSDEMIKCPECSGDIRPYVVWFEEMPHNPEKFELAVSDATHFASVGTSGQVWPAARFIVDALYNNAKVYYSNIEENTRFKSLHSMKGIEQIIGPATISVPILKDVILKDVE